MYKRFLQTLHEITFFIVAYAITIEMEKTNNLYFIHNIYSHRVYSE